MKNLLAPLLRAISGGVRSCASHTRPTPRGSFGGGFTAGEGALDALEPRTMLTVNIINGLPDGVALRNAAPGVFSLAGRYDNPDLNGTVARLSTALGDIIVQLYDETGATRATPATVANFLRYVNAGRYNDSILHDRVGASVLRSGSYVRPSEVSTEPFAILTFPPVANEPGNSNVRGTLAMSKPDGDPNSATSQWFLNLSDNPSLDTANGGFTVFGRIIVGLDVMDALAAVPTFDFPNTVFSRLPLRDFNNGELVNPSDFLNLSISAIPELSYSVLSSDPALVNPSLNGADLALAYGANASGTATITVRVTARDGSFVDDVFTLRVNSAPMIANLTASAPNVRRDTPFTLSVGTATDDAGITKIDFYRDVNGNGAVDVGTDRLLGTDTSADGGWNLATSSSGFPLGAQTLLAVATDSDGVVSAATSTPIGVLNAAPTVSALSATPAPAVRPSPMTLTAQAVDSDGTVSLVRFYVDSNRNGTLELGTDALMGEDSTGGDGFNAIFQTAGVSATDYRFFAVAVDNDGGVSAAFSLPVQVLNAAPVVSGLAASPNLAAGRVPITLTAQASDPDGSVSLVRFYLDSNRNGVLDINTDTLIGEDGNGSDGFTTVIATAGLANADNRFFALATDNEALGGDTALAATVVHVVTTAPVISDLTATPAQVTRRMSFTLSVGAAADDVGVAKIDFYRDSNNNGVLDVGTDVLMGTDTSPPSADGGWSFVTNANGLLIGTQMFFARAADADGELSNVLSVGVEVVAAAPVIALTATPGPVTAGSPITLNVQVVESDSAVGSVRFYRDDNGNGVLDIGTDTLVREDTEGADGFSAVVDTSGLRSGGVGFFAVATDQALRVSNAAIATSIITRTFGVEVLTVTPSPIPRNGKVTIAASQIMLPAGAVFKKVEFYADTNNNGVFDGADKRVGSSSSLRNGGATVQVNTKGLAAGNFMFFARVQDKAGVWSPATSAAATIVNNIPTVRSMKASPTTVKNRGDQVQLSVSGQKDVDGKVTSVRYYRDTPPTAGEGAADGQFDPAVDSLLGTVTSSSGGYKLTLVSTQFTLGLNRYFAVVVDTDGAASAPVVTTNIINIPPTVAGLSVSPDTGPAATTIFSFTAAGVGDANGSVKQVEIFLDSNGNGTLDGNRIDKSLGKAKFVGGVWVLTVKGKGFPAGSYKAFAQATDNTGGLSVPVNVSFTVS